MMRLRFRFSLAPIDQDWNQPLEAFCVGDWVGFFWLNYIAVE